MVAATTIWVESPAAAGAVAAEFEEAGTPPGRALDEAQPAAATAGSSASDARSVQEMWENTERCPATLGAREGEKTG